MYQRKVYYVCAVVAIVLVRKGLIRRHGGTTFLTLCCVCCGRVTVMSGSNTGHSFDGGSVGEGGVAQRGGLDSWKHLNGTWQVEGGADRAATRQCCRQTSPSGFPHTVKSLDDRRQGLQVTGGP